MSLNPALKVDGVTLIIEREKAEAIAAKFSRAHKNTSQSPLNATVENGCCVLHNNGFNVNPWVLTSPREIMKIIKKLKNGVPNILLKIMPRRASVYATYVFNSCIKLYYFPKCYWQGSLQRFELSS
jgi:hypothetical protein